MNAIYKARQGCPECPEPDHKIEWFRFFNLAFDVTKARSLATSAEHGFVTATQLIQYGIQPEPPDPNLLTIGLCSISEAHLAHLPAEALDRPILFATVPYSDAGAKTYMLLIDGAHTATVKVRRGDERIAAVKLSLEQSRECCLRGWPGTLFAVGGMLP